VVDVVRRELDNAIMLTVQYGAVWYCVCERICSGGTDGGDRKYVLIS